MPIQLISRFSPDPILSACDSFCGSVIDLSRERVVGSADLSWARDDLAARLKNHGLNAGDRVILAVSNGAQFPVALAAILQNDASPLLLHSESPLAEIKRTASRFRAKFYLTDHTREAYQAEATKNAQIFSFDDWLTLRWGQLDGSESARRLANRPFGAAPLHPTSGSTGSPKVALRPGTTAVAEAEHYIRTLQITSEDTIFALTPMSHAYAYGMCVMVPLVSGASVVTMRRFSAVRVRQAFHELPITILPSTPAILDTFSFGNGRAFPRSLRWVLTAGSLLSARTAKEFYNASGLHAHPLYGTTETGGISIATTVRDDLIAGCVGPPMQGVSVDVRPPESAAHLGTDVGRLWVNSSSMMAGYLDEDDRVTSPLEMGWFQTGDLAKLDPIYGIQLRGRESDVINVLGMKVIPCEVEEVIAEAPGVREVAVYSEQLRSAAEIVKAAVVVSEGTDAARIREYCREHLVYYKRPAVISVVERLPRSAAGKINRRELP